MTSNIPYNSRNFPHNCQLPCDPSHPRGHHRFLCLRPKGVAQGLAATRTRVATGYECVGIHKMLKAVIQPRKRDEPSISVAQGPGNEWLIFWDHHQIWPNMGKPKGQTFGFDQLRNKAHLGAGTGRALGTTCRPVA